MTRSPHEPIRTALIGCGNSGRHYHLPMLLHDPRFQLRVVAAGSAEGLEGLDVPADVARVVGWADAISSDDVELVVAALPHDLHHPVAAAALSQKKHVLVEKPMTTTVAEADDLLQRAERAQRVLAVHHQRRWEDDVVHLINVVQSGEIGEPWRISVTRGHQGHYARTAAHAPHVGAGLVDWVRDRHRGGGVARLIGPHPIDHALALAGSPVIAVSGWMHYGAGDAAEDWIGIEMAFASGAQGRVEVFRRIGVGPARAAVWGTEGMAVATDGTHVEVRRNDAHPRSITGLRRPGTLGDEIYDDVAAAIRQGGALRVSALNARDVVEVIELAERSAARGGAPIRVDRR